MSRIFRIHLEIENNPYSENEIVSFLYLKFYFENFCYLYLAKDKNFTYFIYRIALSCLMRSNYLYFSSVISPLLSNKIALSCLMRSNYLYFSSVILPLLSNKIALLCLSKFCSVRTKLLVFQCNCSARLKIYLCLNIHKWRSCSSRFGLSSR
ncbi:uncharacterized protein OCT59_026101 [Rhizophagus irregularis]|uniref:uncharacterized protein n=1 Tax=Rhizophagus irregularis TaxID=588596 RepID=UPI003332A31C|nr:hypothetical protein OCT59_026101 [Rhizophagus irregularis]